MILETCSSSYQPRHCLTCIDQHVICKVAITLKVLCCIVFVLVVAVNNHMDCNEIMPCLHISNRARTTTTVPQALLCVEAIARGLNHEITYHTDNTPSLKIRLLPNSSLLLLHSPASLAYANLHTTVPILVWIAPLTMSSETACVAWTP